MRRPHYLKANNSQEYPRHCVWFDTETTQEPISVDTVKHVLNFGYACYRRRSRGHKWSGEQWFRFTTIDQFWEWLTSHIGPKESYTIFAHNGAFDLPVLDAFNWLQDEGWTLRNAVIESPPVILKWSLNGRSIRFIDTLNIWRMSLARLGKSIGIDKLDFPDEHATQDYWDQYGKRDVEIIMAACIRWFDFIREHELGGFAPTLASQAVRAFRHRFMGDKILIDDNEDALALARQAYHGGRTECFFIGETDERLYQLDVNSMYPNVMKHEVMPTALVGLYRRVKHLELHKLLKSFCLVAEVAISTPDPIYPQFVGGKLIFPVGEFDTVLSTPELQYALDAGHIMGIDRVAIYQRAVIFARYVDYLYQLRKDCQAQGDIVTAGLAKLLLNSLYGKFGQRGRVYETVDQVDDKTIATWTEIDADTGQVHQWRQFAGMIQQLTNEPESRDSHPAIAAHVTAHARMDLWGIYQQAGLENCFYSDTDCVVVNQVGFDNLADRIDAHRLGALDLEKVIEHASIRGPKDYKFDELERIKGVKKTARWLDANTVEQEQWSGLRGLLARGDLTAPTTKTMTKNLKRVYTKGVVTPSGRVTPFRYG